jgi:hypothetical protein
MSDTDAKSAPVSRAFVGLWLLSSIVPALLFTAGQYVLAPHMADSPWAEIAILLSFPIWLLLGLLQFPLLRTRLRRGWVWIAATFVGGVVGHMAGGLSRIRTEPYVEELLLRSELGSGELPAWALDVYPVAPVVLASVINVAVVAILQSFCFDKAMGGRAVWILSSILAGILGPICTVLVGWNLLALFFKAGVAEMLVPRLSVTLLTVPLAPLVNFTIYGLITGVVMRWLLIRRTRRQRETLVGQFE